jgi:hypothetical protein
MRQKAEHKVRSREPGVERKVQVSMLHLLVPVNGIVKTCCKKADE